MSGDWFRDLVEQEDSTPRAQEHRKPPLKRRSSMRRLPSSPKGGMISTPQIACLAAGVLAVSVATLLYTSLLLSPALLRVALKDVMCDSIQNAANLHRSGSSSKIKKISILLGTFTVASNVERRSLLRLAYGVQQPTKSADVTVKFVIGKPASDELNKMITLESFHYGDILVLDCEENMNHGKSFKFFDTVAAMAVHYDYVMKADEDSYIRLENLAASLQSQSREDLYYGYVLPCESDDAYKNYMAGMGYVISWDLVQWLHESPIPRNSTDGTEDQLMGDWLNAGNKAKHRVSKKPLFYDHPAFGGGCAHELVPETILVHQVKTPERWHDVLSFFERDRIAISSWMSPNQQLHVEKLHPTQR